MAQNATIFKAALQVADLERDYYHEHALTIARHPSETDERMMVRLLAFARHAHEDLRFGRGLDDDEEPDLWRKDPTGAIDAWIDVGQPDERRIRRACGRAGAVFVYSYGGRAADRWWAQTAPGLDRVANLTVVGLPVPGTQALAKLARRTMRLDCTIQGDHVWIADVERSVTIEPVTLKSARKPA
jgi:uncharacterized protein YaeQ